MNKLEFVQILSIFLVIVTVINYGLHSSIIKQDEVIRDRAVEFVDKHCKIELVSDYGQLAVFNFTLDINNTGFE